MYLPDTYGWRGHVGGVCCISVLLLDFFLISFDFQMLDEVR